LKSFEFFLNFFEFFLKVFDVVAEETSGGAPGQAGERASGVVVGQLQTKLL